MSIGIKTAFELVSGLVLAVTLGSSVSAQSRPDSRGDRSLPESSFSRIPVSFIENREVVPGGV